MEFDAKVAEQALPVGTRLSGDQFTITELLGAGGFGITYRAMDNVLGRIVVLKECFPENLCYRNGRNVSVRKRADADTVEDIVKMFMREARSLAKLRHPNIVGVHRAFEENETAYMALDLIDGLDLFDILASKSTPLSPGRIKNILIQMLDAIEEVHKVDLLHRDISPDNIIIERDGTPILIDFGAARGDASRQTRAVSTLMVVKEGYSPQEFYVAGSKQYPCSDLYALGATFYHVISGKAPPDSQTRMIEIAGNRPDPCKPLAGRIKGFGDDFLAALDAAMAIHPADRLQSAEKWRSLIIESEVSERAISETLVRPKSRDVSLELEVSLSKLVQETNHEVRKSKDVSEPAPAPVVKKETPSKRRPDWVDEFNQESLAPKVTRQVSRDKLDDLDRLDEMMSAENRPAAQSQAARPTSETNWVGLAQEKQNIRLQQEAAHYGLFDDDQPERVLSVPQGAPVRIPGDPPLVEVHQEKRRGFGSFKIFLTLLLISGSLMLMQAS